MRSGHIQAARWGSGYGDSLVLSGLTLRLLVAPDVLLVHHGKTGFFNSLITFRMRCAYGLWCVCGPDPTPAVCSCLTSVRDYRPSLFSPWPTALDSPSGVRIAQRVNDLAHLCAKLTRNFATAILATARPRHAALCLPVLTKRSAFR